MDFLKYAIGIDVGMEKLVACISLITTQQQVIVKAQCSFNNDKKGFALLYAWAIRNIKFDIPTIFLMEATGIYYEQLAWFLNDKGCIVSVVLPNKAKKYKILLSNIILSPISYMICSMPCLETKPLKKCILNNWFYYKRTRKIYRN